MGISVLLIEDSPDLACLYKLVIEETGCSVITAQNGTKALSLLAHIVRPSLILLDFLMPEMNGEAFLRIL